MQSENVVIVQSSVTVLTPRQIGEKIVAELVRNFSERILRVFLFGSRVGNRQLNPCADIDIGFVATEPLCFAELAQVHDFIESLPTLLSVDLVDFTNRHDEFVTEALQHIEVLYEAPRINAPTR